MNAKFQQTDSIIFSGCGLLSFVHLAERRANIWKCEVIPRNIMETFFLVINLLALGPKCGQEI